MAKKPITEIAEKTPASLRFAIIVSVAIFWADVLRYVLVYFFAGLGIETHGIEESLLLAVVASLVGLGVLSGYRGIHRRLKKIEVQT